MRYQGQLHQGQLRAIGTATTIVVAIGVGLANTTAVGTEPIRRILEPCTDITFTGILPEQKRICVRDASQFPSAGFPLVERPTTVVDEPADIPTRDLPLDEAISIALRNSEVVRVLTGVSASTSGRTIYDTAISNVAIDQARAIFDPTLAVNNRWDRLNTPFAVPNVPVNPTTATFDGFDNDLHAFDLALAKRNEYGGIASLNVRNSNRRIHSPGFALLDPQNTSAVEMVYTQPLWQGAGRAVNRVPIVLARNQTERSYFQYKGSVQNLVQGVIEGYWSLVSSKTSVWTREQQLALSEFSLDRAESRLEAGEGDAGEVAQARVALENFRAGLLAERGTLLLRQTALLNLLGFSPYESDRLVPVTPMIDEYVEIDWFEINSLAERQRPDIIELKLVLEADQQRLMQAANFAQPRLDAGALYRWNGLEGEVPNGTRVQTGAGDFNDWSLSINFSVPLGLRAERAALRQEQLLLRRDRANLQQALHQMQHQLTLSVRNLDQFYAQYERFQAVREAAEKNLELQIEKFKTGNESFIVVLQAIGDWGSAVNSEANSLLQYNTELARLQLQTGTILETHGIVFFEERFRSVGPLGWCADDHCYPLSRRPGQNVDRYEQSDTPSEEFFDLQNPTERADGQEKDTDLDVDLDEDVEYEEVGPDDREDREGPMSDEEIDELLERDRTSRWHPIFLKHFLRR